VTKCWKRKHVDLKSGWLSAVALLVVWSPRISQACSVCGVGREDENRLAFILTTVFLTFLPLSMIGGIVWYLRRRYLQLESESELESEAERSAPVLAAGATR
jgi:hypothetical protein